ncbi:MAG: hypothetical protein KF815_03575 [Rhodospirillales bacterium]|nr:hypothetical protein [Rhodospirillales bacterium]
MLPFSYRQFLRQVPAQTIREFLSSRGRDIDQTVDWRADEAQVARQLAAAIDAWDDDAGAEIVADFERAHFMSDERGYAALLNASHDRESLAERLANLENGQERALRVLIDDDGLFRAAEEIRYFDYYVERSQGRRYQVQADLALDRTDDAIQRFGAAMSSWFRKRDGSGQAFFAEVIDRYSNDSVQVTLYVEDLPSNRPEFEKRQFRRRPSRPAKEAAVVYVPATGCVETVAKGGKPVHEALRDIFGEHVLGIPPGGELILAQEFDLQGLLVDRVLPVNRADGVIKARIRRLKLEAPRKGQGAILIDTPPWEDAPSAHAFARTWLSSSNPINGGFEVVHATISLHLEAPAGRRGKALHVELTKPCSTNLKNFRRNDRELIERHLRDWQIIP